MDESYSEIPNVDLVFQRTLGMLDSTQQKLHNQHECLTICRKPIQ